MIKLGSLLIFATLSIGIFTILGMGSSQDAWADSTLTVSPIGLSATIDGPRVYTNPTTLTIGSFDPIFVGDEITVSAVGAGCDIFDFTYDGNSLPTQITVDGTNPILGVLVTNYDGLATNGVYSCDIVYDSSFASSTSIGTTFTVEDPPIIPPTLTVSPIGLSATIDGPRVYTNPTTLTIGSFDPIFVGDEITVSAVGAGCDIFDFTYDGNSLPTQITVDGTNPILGVLVTNYDGLATNGVYSCDIVYDSSFASSTSIGTTFTVEDPPIIPPTLTVSPIGLSATTDGPRVSNNPTTLTIGSFDPIFVGDEITVSAVGAGCDIFDFTYDGNSLPTQITVDGTNPILGVLVTNYDGLATNGVYSCDIVYDSSFASSTSIGVTYTIEDPPITGEIIMLKDVFNINDDENVVADILIGEQVFDYYSVHIAVNKEGIDDDRAFSLSTDYFLPDGNMRLEGQISTQFQGPGSYEFVLSVVELAPGFPKIFLDSAEFEITDDVPPDTIPPVITLRFSQSNINLEQGGYYPEYGAYCFDDVDGQINGNVVISGDTVDTSAPVSTVFTIDYDCDDASGNSATTVQKTVTIIPPILRTLYVSAENSQFDNYMSGPQVIEVIVIDESISNADVALGEPDVTVNGKTLRMVQAIDGNWYGYFADRTYAQIADSTAITENGIGLDYGDFCNSNDGYSVLGFDLSDTSGFAVSNTGEITGVIGSEHGGSIINNCSYTPGTPENTMNVLREAPVLNIHSETGIGQIGLNSADNWPFIQLIQLNPTGQVVVQYNYGGSVKQTILTFDTVDQFASTELDRNSYFINSQVYPTITDLWLNIDPTDEDSWTFGTVASSAPSSNYQVFDENGVSVGDTPENTDNNLLTGFLDALMCEDNCRLLINSNAQDATNPVLTLQDNDDTGIVGTDANDATSFQTLGGNLNGKIPITITESSSNSGVFVMHDESDSSILKITDNAAIGTSGTIDYNESPLTILVVPSPILPLNFGDASVNEDEGTVLIPVTWDSTDPAFAGLPTFTFGYATSDGTATAGSDYTAFNIIITHSTASEIITLSFPITDDLDVESDETFTVTLTDPKVNNAVIGTSVVTIIDNDIIPVATFCNDMTIDELVASGNYNVIDNRDGHLDGSKIKGTNGDDLILASDAGNDIRAKKGNDCVIGGAGNDQLRGGNGDDTMYGLDGNDRMIGGNQNDLLYGGEGNDRISGSKNNDQLFGENGDDNVNGGSGDDALSCGDGADKANGGKGTDTATADCETIKKVP